MVPPEDPTLSEKIVQRIVLHVDFDISTVLSIDFVLSLNIMLLEPEKWIVLKCDIKVKREVLKLAQLMLGLFCCSKTISYQ